MTKEPYDMLLEVLEKLEKKYKASDFNVLAASNLVLAKQLGELNARMGNMSDLIVQLATSPSKTVN